MKLRKILILLMAVLFVIPLQACTNNANAANKAEDQRIQVVTTIFPQYDFTREIAGELADITMLLPPGSESHSFEPTPQDVIKIQNCDIFIYVGGDSDHWVDEILTSMDTSNMKIISLMECVETVEEELVEGMEHDHEEGEAHDDHRHGEYDEHVWTSPKNAEKIVQVISAALCEADPENASSYEESTKAYQAQLTALDTSFREVTENAKHKVLLFGDRFPFRYFADEYGLTYYAAFPGCAAETEASAKTVAFLIDKVKEENIPVVFHIEFSNGKMADAICLDTGAEKRLLHSCHNVSRADMEAGTSYLNLMEQNVEILKEALN